MYMPDRIYVAALADLQDLTPIRLTHRRVPYVVVKIRDVVRAFIAICPHEDRSFPPQITGDCLVCPLHGVSFDSASGSVRDTHGKEVPRGLCPVETTVQDGVVYIIGHDVHQAFVAESSIRRRRRNAEKRRQRVLGLFSALGRRHA